MSKVLNNQVRLASCKEDEEAAEGPAWGGGRGVFSYYLLMGLNGKAEVKEVVRLKGLQTFIDSAFRNDRELKLENHTQNPVIDGNDTFQLAFIDSATLFAIKNGAERASNMPSNGLESLRTIGKQPMDYFFVLLENSYLENELDFNSYKQLDPKEIPARMVQDCMKSRQKILDKIKSEDDAKFELYQYDIDNQIKMDQHLETLNSALDSNKLSKLLGQLQENRFLVARFNEKFVQVIQGKAQEMINAYLKGDISELEKRQYYYAGNRNYRKFLPLLKTAIHLTPESNYLNEILQINEAYLAGVIDRLDIATHQKEADSLLKSAFAHQFRAMQLEPYAAYIHNELGNLYFQKKQFDSAAFHFNFASLLSPTWAIPWSNKIRLNLAINNLSKAKEAIIVADSLEPNLAYVNTNSGLVMEKDGNLLAAESYYLQAIAQNSVHYLPFERLGYIYIQTGAYAKADSFLYEAAQRKDKFAVNDAVFLFGIGLGGPGEFEAGEHYIGPCTIPYDSAVAGWNTVINLVTGISKIDLSSSSENKQGENMIRETLSLLPNIPLANHYLGKKYYKEGNWKQAEIELKKACSNFMASDELKSYFKSVLADSFRKNSPKGELSKFSLTDSTVEKALESINKLVDSSCLLGTLVYLNYNQVEDYYMLGSIFEKRGLTEDAIAQYRIISRIENIQQLNQAKFVGYLRPELQEDLKDTLLTKNPPHIKEEKEESNKISAKMGEESDQLSMQLNLFEMNELTYKYNNPIKMGGSLKAARLYEQEGQFKNAEQILLQQVSQNRSAGFAREEEMKKKNFGPAGEEVYNYYWLNINKNLETETYNFYARMVAKFPRDAYWYQKAGQFLYNRLALTYYQMPLNERYYFYTYSLNHAYPFAGSIEGPNEIQVYNPAALVKADIVFNLPGSNEKIEIDTSTYDPVKTANFYLQQAIRFSGDVNPDPSVLESIADLQSWLNKSDSAINKYEYLIKLQPTNVSLRNKLIDNLVLNNALPQACIQLESLYKSRQIRHGQLLQLARYQMLLRAC